MGRVNYTQRHVSLGNGNSNLTGAVWFVGDAGTLSVSVQSSHSSAGSRWTLVGSNDDGFTAALGTPSYASAQNGWSVVTTLTQAGLYTIDCGFRWITSFRSNIEVSASSNVTITFVQKVN